MNIKKYYRVTLMCSIILVCVTVFILLSTKTSVFHKQKKEAATPSNAEIAFIYDDSTDSYSKSMITKGIESASHTLDKKCGFYSCDDYGDSKEKTINAAIKNGAILLICPDASYEESIYSVQNTYVNTYFMLIDGIPHNKDSSDSSINYNVIPLSFDEAEAGFLAGYAAVYEGYSNFAFVGDNTIASKHYGYGVLQGADYAAKELSNKITIETSYLKNVKDASKTAYNLYRKNAQMIIANNPSIINSVTEVAEELDKPVITCNSDSINNSDVIIANASRNLTSCINDAILNYFSGQLKGGSIMKLNASNNGIILDFSKKSFKYFTQDNYDSIYAELTKQNIQIISDTTVSTADLGLTNVTVVN